MNTLLDRGLVSGRGRVEIQINVSAEVQITAAVARRRVSRLVIGEIGNLLYGGEPTLVVGEPLRWRVPILAYPDSGPVGEVGAIDVDAETGELFITPEKIEQINEYANYLAQRTTHRPDRSI
ncbi:MAG: hypothetical protein KJ063_06295 [Anaerolineae bacterium]|nr:hypothetical protein [Anaerolineae bacterium]